MAKRDGERVPWIKLFGDYTTSPSHVALDARALWVGVVLMQLVRAGCDARDDREPWALLKDGSPVPLAAIARMARWNPQITKRSLEMLAAAGTAAMREDGAWGVPKFWHHQETKWAKQKRGQRGGQSASQSAGRPRQEKKSSPSENKESPLEGGSPPKPTDPHVEVAARVLTGLNRRLVALGEPGKLVTTKHILALLRQREDCEIECELVLDEMADEAARTGDVQWLNTSTPFKPSNFEWRLAKARQWAKGRGAPAQGSLLSAEQIRRAQEADDAATR